MSFRLGTKITMKGVLIILSVVVIGNAMTTLKEKGKTIKGNLLFFLIFYVHDCSVNGVKCCKYFMNVNCKV